MMDGGEGGSADEGYERTDMRTRLRLTLYKCSFSAPCKTDDSFHQVTFFSLADVTSLSLDRFFPVK